VRRVLLGALIALATATQALAHASLVASDPADGKVVPVPPAALTLRFNEPVSPLVIRLIDPAGDAIALADVRAENAIVSIPLLSMLATGTHVLSWRVISADGHPVAGAVVFSIGAPSATPAASSDGDAGVRAGLWALKLVIYLGLFVGVGGAFFLAWVEKADRRPGEPVMVALLACGLLAVPLSVGLQGLDALDLPPSALRQQIVWIEGLQTAYGATAIAAAFALLAGLLALAPGSRRLARALSLCGLLAVGLAFALSGHASTAPPQLVSRTALLVHGACVAFWIGALLPLAMGARCGGSADGALARFSRAIPLPLLLLVASGAWLVVAQLDRIDALWRTSYGQVLACKLALVALLLVLAACNRYRLTPRLVQGDRTAAHSFAMSITAELVLAVAILALVALWRFTPPPRALALAPPISIHLHGDKAMAEITLARAAGQGAQLQILDSAFAPLSAQEVVLVLANPAAGIEPIRRPAVRLDETNWRIDGLSVPIAGRWTLRVEILVSDFDKLTLEDTATLPRLP
jgi:copper transport protein